MDVVYGSREHASMVTESYHPAIQDYLQWLTFAHLPEALQPFSEPFYTAGVALLDTIPAQTAGEEVTLTLRTLVDAKDWAVRAGIRSQTGRAGSIPRPSTVVLPPTLSS